MLPGAMPCTHCWSLERKYTNFMSSAEHERNAEEIQTNTAMFAGQIHKKKKGGTVNTDTQITIQRALEVFDTTMPWQDSAAELK